MAVRLFWPGRRVTDFCWMEDLLLPQQGRPDYQNAGSFSAEFSPIQCKWDSLESVSNDEASIANFSTITATCGYLDHRSGATSLLAERMRQASRAGRRKSIAVIPASDTARRD